MRQRGDLARILCKGVPAKTKSRRNTRAGRWVVERTHSWTNRASLGDPLAKEGLQLQSDALFQFALVTFQPVGVLPQLG